MQMTLSREPAVVPLRTSQNTEETDDAALVARAKSGNVEAFEALYRRHGGRVHALCLRLTADGQRAAELTQDVFVRAWDGLPAFRGESAFGSWLHRIAVNASLMSRRSDQRRTSRVSLAEDLATPTTSAPDAIVAPRDVESAIDLERALQSLPAGARAAFVLHEIEGYTHEEIAGLTGIAAGTVRAQLHRARRLLMEALER
jgi:RNA polymerase sigma-70 factor (ECF subfamily)